MSNNGTFGSVSPTSIVIWAAFVSVKMGLHSSGVDAGGPDPIRHSQANAGTRARIIKPAETAQIVKALQSSAWRTRPPNA